MGNNNHSANAWPNKEQTWLLRACLLSGFRAQEAWNAWISLVDFDKIDPASYKLLPLVSRNPSLEHLQNPIFEKCKGVYRLTWVSNHLSWGKLFSTLGQLGKAGVDKIVLLKGMAMILHFYRDFGVRVIGDIDILIAKTKLPIAISLLLDSGWKHGVPEFDIKNEEHLKRWHALHFTHPDGLNLDLHWSFIEENSPALDEAVFEGAKPLSNFLYVPNPTDLLLQTCIHGVKYSPVPLIRWVADAMTILKNGKLSINWDRFSELAAHAHVCTQLYSALQYLIKQFDAPIPQKALRALKTSPSVQIKRLERLEHRFNLQGSHKLAGWCRYCLTRGHLTTKSQILNLHKYLQFAARLKSPWHIPFFGAYWVCRRFFRSFKRK